MKIGYFDEKFPYFTYKNDIWFLQVIQKKIADAIIFLLNNENIRIILVKLDEKQ